MFVVVYYRYRNAKQYPITNRFAKQSTIYYNLTPPEYKGYIGEKIVATILEQLNKEQYKIYNDILIPNNQTKNQTQDLPLTQIDHLIISKYGIFVIETKHWSGYISGDDSSVHWKQNIQGHFTSPSLNPIKQNYGHICALNSILNIDKKFFIPIVVFTNKPTLCIETNNIVIHENQLLDVIQSYNQPIIENIDNLDEKLTQHIVTDEQYISQHKQYVHQYILEKQENERNYINNAICPNYRNYLIIKYRNDNKPFLACEGFPYCKYTRNIKKNAFQQRKHNLVIRHGNNYHAFIGCTDYPNCNFKIQHISDLITW